MRLVFAQACPLCYSKCSQFTGPESYLSSPPLQKRPADENQPPVTTPSKKRRKQDKRAPLSSSAVPNQPLTDVFITPQQSHKPESTRQHFNDNEKFERICDALEVAHWSFTEMLAFAFTHPTTSSQSKHHAGIISRFLCGECTVMLGAILRLWNNHPDGRIEREENMFSLDRDTHYSQIKPIRPSLTSYATQKCLEKKKSKDSCKLEWQCIGLGTVETVEDITCKLMPLSVSLMSKMAGGGPAIPKPLKPEPTSQVVGDVVEESGGVQAEPAQDIAVGSSSEVRDGQAMEGVVQMDEKVNARHPTNLVTRVYGLISWNPNLSRPGFVKVSAWIVQCPTMDADLALALIAFTSVNKFGNLARMDISAVFCLQFSANATRYHAVTKDGTPFIFLTTGFLETSQLTKPSPVGLKQRFVRIIPHKGEFQRTASAVCTVFGFDSMKTQYARHALQFSTRAEYVQSTPSKPSSSAGHGKGSVAPGMFSGPSSGTGSRMSADNFSLPHTAQVPVYDARDVEDFNLETDLAHLDSRMPRWNEEIPYGSFVAVGYTATAFYGNAREWTLGLNIQWVIVVGIPEANTN
ncbi:hypothetical protein NMY22_g10706 [Coprinellus aureogranulatus]|nr:hypothetical protein NMY22_g10706 [Coprinellus aureogranulatus]